MPLKIHSANFKNYYPFYSSLLICSNENQSLQKKTGSTTCSWHAETPRKLLVLLKPFSKNDSTKLWCTVTVPTNLHMQTGIVWMAAWLEHAACQLQAVDWVSFAVRYLFFAIGNLKKKHTCVNVAIIAQADRIIIIPIWPDLTRPVWGLSVGAIGFVDEAVGHEWPSIHQKCQG